MRNITATKLKNHGISAIESALAKDSVAVIIVKDQPCYVVMPIEEFERLRKTEIYSAWREARAAVAVGKYRIETAAVHLSRLHKI